MGLTMDRNVLYTVGKGAVKVPDILFINKKKSTTPTQTVFELCSDLFRLMLL